MNSNETKHFQLFSIHEKFDAMLKGYVFLQLYCVDVFLKVVKINFPRWHESISAVVKFKFRGVKIQIPRC